MYPENDKIEREQVEWVFRLTGGELSEKPMRIAVPKTNVLYGLPNAPRNEKPTEWRRWWIHYFYDGVPDYVVEHELRRKSGSFVTIIRDCSFGEPPRRFLKAGKIYRRVALYRSSGETECPLRTIHECSGYEDHPTTVDEHGLATSIVTEEDEKRSEGGKECPLCGASIGEEHGCIYLGDGWCEVVYRARD